MRDQKMPAFIFGTAVLKFPQARSRGIAGIIESAGIDENLLSSL